MCLFTVKYTSEGGLEVCVSGCGRLLTGGSLRYHSTPFFRENRCFLVPVLWKMLFYTYTPTLSFAL